MLLDTHGAGAELARPGRGTLADGLGLMFRSPMDVIKNALRGVIVADEGKELIVADYTAVEGRGIAWLSGAEHMLEIFRRDEDVYLKAAADVFGYPCTKKDHPFERSVGKVVILACGYQGSVGAFQSMARGYGVSVPDKEALKIVKAWRLNNPEIVTYWSTVEAAAIRAVEHPGETTRAGAPGREVYYLRHGSFLFCRLPSGRALAYPFPRLVPYIWIKRTRLDTIVSEESGLVDYEETTESRRVQHAHLERWLEAGWEQNGEPGPGLHYSYQAEGRWTEGPTYGGSLCENITQAVCRDLLAEAIPRLEAASYPVVLHVHDEAVSEVPLGFGSVKEYESLMAHLSPWAKDFPLKAEGWRGPRYHK